MHRRRWRKHGNPDFVWKDGRTTTPQGYVRLRVDGRYVLEHRLVVERAIGRKLTRAEVVHHRDGNRANNRLGNLEILSRAGHTSLHSKDRGHAINRTASHRWCPMCRSVLPSDAFWRDTSRRTGTQSACKSCHNQKRKAWRHRTGRSKAYRN